RQNVRQQSRMPEHLWTVTEPAVEHAPFLIRAGPTHRKILVLLPRRENPAVRRDSGLLRIDPQQHMQMIAQHRLLKLKRLIGDLEILSLKYRIQRTPRVLNFDRHGLAVPGMSAVLGRPNHLSE